MVESIFFLPGRPKPKNERNAGAGGRIYYSQDVKAHQKALELMASPYAPAAPIVGPVWLDLAFWMPIPKKPGQDQADGQPHIFKPDSDNLVKMVKDALTNAGFWVDDCQVFNMKVSKCYGPTPGTTITVKWLDR